MTQMEKAYFEKRGQILVKNLRNRHFDAWYCDTKEDALAKVLELIPQGAKIGWGGVLSAQQIGLFDALRSGNYDLLDRDLCKTQEEREQMMKDALFSDVFLTGANGLSLDGQMVNIDGTGNRVAAIAFGPKTVLVIAGILLVRRYELSRFSACAVMMMLGGAIGNLIDRFLYGYVVDMFEVLAFDFAVFNAADAFLTIGCAMTAYALLFRRNDWREKQHGNTEGNDL